MTPRAVWTAIGQGARSRLWPIPAAAVVFAAVGGILMPRLDAHIDASLPGWLGNVLFGGDPGAARTVLDAVSSSLITVTSLTFSLTVVTLQLASSQFSPRLLRTFTSDLFVQGTLGLFLATFTYSLAVLRSVRGGSGSSTTFVPRLAVSCAFVLAIVSVVGLVLFLAHLARQIRVETMMRDVHEDALETFRSTLGHDSARAAQHMPEPPTTAIPLRARRSGFIVRIDDEALVELAQGTEAIIAIASPGASVVAGMPIGAAWGQAGPLSDDAAHHLEQGVGAAVHIGYERTEAQDVGYGLRQLTDIANKALSPGINDPTTAVHALGHISALLCTLANEDLGVCAVHDTDGLPRVVVRRPSWGELVDEALTQPRRYGIGDPQVARRLFELLHELAVRAPAAHRGDIHIQLGRLCASVARADFDDIERRQLAEAEDRVRRALSS